MNQRILLTLGLSILLAHGSEALARALTPPQGTVKKITDRTGANLGKALEERDEAAKAWADFLLVAVGGDAENPDPEALRLFDVDPDSIDPGRSKSAAPAIPLFDIAVTLYRTFGRTTVKRMLTPPGSLIERVADATGQDPQDVLEARNDAVEELLEFLEAITQRNFEDPD